MTLLPIIDRELRVVARRKSTYHSRLFPAASMIVLLAGAIVLISRRIPPNTVGMILFGLFAVSALTSVLLGGSMAAADAISSEKREGTLGLLFLTDLTGGDVVFGKLTVACLSAFYGQLLGTLPIMAIPVLMGGVSIDVFVRLALVLINTLFFAIAAGLFVSSLSRSASRAAFWTLLIVFVVAFGAPLLGAFLKSSLADHRLYVRDWFLVAFLFPSPGYAGYLALMGTGAATSRMFYLALASVHAASWIFLFAAARIVPRVWQDRPETVSSLRWKERLRTWGQGSRGERLAYRRRLLEVNPVLWLTSRNRLKPMYVWAVLATLGCAWFWGYWRMPDQWLGLGISVAFACIYHFVLKAWIAQESTVRFGEDVRSGALELLLCSGLSVREILRGQLLALRRQFFLPVLILLLAESLLLVVGWYHRQNGGLDRADIRNLAWAHAAGIVVFAVDMYVINWVGMYAAVSAKITRNAPALTMILVMFLPWMLCGGLGAACGYFWRIELGFHVQLAAWFVFSLAVDYVLWRFARYWLLGHLRTMVAERYVGADDFPFWQRLGRALKGKRPNLAAKGQ